MMKFNIPVQAPIIKRGVPTFILMRLKNEGIVSLYQHCDRCGEGTPHRKAHGVIQCIECDKVTVLAG